MEIEIPHVVTARSPIGSRVIPHALDGQPIVGAYAACVSEGWLDVWDTYQLNGRTKVRVEGKKLMTKRIHTAFYLQDRRTGDIVARTP